MQLQAAWRSRGLLACSLLPWAWLYGRLVWLHQCLYRWGIRRSTRLPVPVAVVGNVVAGGAGKTPVVLALLEHFQSRGFNVGVISRGYGRYTHDCREVQEGDRPQHVGDEPLLIRRRAQVPVFVAKNRAQAARALLARYPETQLLICDDGLQHLALARDLEIVVFAASGTGNGWLLPAGPLREPWPRAGAPTIPSFVLCAGDAATSGGLPAKYLMRRSLATYALDSEGKHIPLDTLTGQSLHALAAIARPEAFFGMLRARGLTVANQETLPDHYDFDSWQRPIGKSLQLVCTEKDAAKLWQHAPEALAIPLELDIDPAFLVAVDAALGDRLTSTTNAKSHGQETP